MLAEVSLFVFSLVIYCNSLWCGFVFDDVSAIRDNQDLRPSTSLLELFKNDFWGTPMDEERSHKSYRPFTVLTFRINYLFHELSPVGYHAVNVILHSLVVILFFKLCSCYLQKEAAFLSSILFSAHPVHTEAVTGVVGRAELLSSAMFLSAILLYIGGQDGLCKHRRTVDFLNVLTVGLLILIGTFSKEQCITVFGVFFTYELYTVYQKILSNGIGSSQSGFKKGSCQKSRTLVDMIPCTCQQLQFKLSLPVWISYASICRILILLLFVFAIMVARIRIMGGQLPHFTDQRLTITAWNNKVTTRSPQNPYDHQKRKFSKYKASDIGVQCGCDCFQYRRAEWIRKAFLLFSCLT
ncbi:unnamed protein product [Heterobilharzia americana]|nr:unnamed protein product [Heterobilharzia americana]